MQRSRLSRFEEKRITKQLIRVIAGIFILIILIYFLGIPLLVKTSLFLGQINSKTPLSYDKDTTAPLPPMLFPAESATNSARIKIEGNAEPESTLTLLLNGQKIKEVALGTDGSFSFSGVDLETGDNMLYAYSTDEAGNQSSRSKKMTVLFSKDAPRLEITQPSEKQTFGPKEENITVRGTTNPGVSIALNDRFVSVKDDGSFEYNFKLSAGDNLITIIARDQAGNETKITRTVSYSLD